MEEKERKDACNSINAVQISILENKKNLKKGYSCDVNIYMTSEFRNEPESVISEKQRIELVAQKIKEKFIEFLSKEIL